MGVNLDLGLYQPYLTVTQNADGTFAATVAPGLFSDSSIGKAFFKNYAPGMVTGGTNFYPAEATLITYSLASGDPGYDDAWSSRVKTLVNDISGLDVTNNLLYGDSG